MWTPPLAALLLLATSAPEGGRSREALMDEIEQTVVLPNGAGSLADYGRNYAFNAAGTVLARYLRPLPRVDASSGCGVMLRNLTMRRCTRKEVEQSVQAEARRRAAETPAGTRRWLDDYRKLPFISDGGCSQVNIEYDVAAHHVIRVSCNGYA